MNELVCPLEFINKPLDRSITLCLFIFILSIFLFLLILYRRLFLMFESAIF